MMDNQVFSAYNPAFGDAEVLPVYRRNKFLIVRHHTIPGIESEYYTVNARMVVADCNEIAGAFDLRDWFDRNYPKAPDGTDFYYQVMRGRG